MIAKLKSQFAVEDRNDLLAMTALQLSIRIKEIEFGVAKSAPEENSENKEEDLKLATSVEDLIQRLNAAIEG